jgi:hypothetical protein
MVIRDLAVRLSRSLGVPVLLNRQLALSAPPATIWNGWRNIGKGVFSDYGRFLAEGKFDDIVRLTKQL